MSTELIQHQRLTEIVGQYAQAQREIAEGFALLASAKGRLTGVFGGMYDSIFDERIDDFNLPREAARSDKKIRRNAWSYIAKLTNLRQFMSSKKSAEFDKQLNDGNLPELTEESVLSTLMSLSEKISDLTTEAIREAFAILRPRHNRHKTNRRYEIGPKAILPGYINYNYGTVSLSYYQGDSLRSIDNAFHLLAGAGVPEYPRNLEAVIRDAMVRGESSAETKFFKLSWFKAGTLHIEFKRLDLLERLNAIGGEGMLKGES